MSTAEEQGKRFSAYVVGLLATSVLVPGLAQETAMAEASANLQYASPSFTSEGPQPPSLRWGTGDAYLNLRERRHRAEEALIEVEPASLAIGEAQYDVRRVDGSR